VTRLEWGDGARLFEQGLDRGVLYLDDGAVPWNGLVGVQEHIEAEVDTSYYYDGVRTHIVTNSDEFGASIRAYTYPDIFAEYNGYGPKHTYKRFGLSYRTEYGSGYQLHLVYNAMVHDGDRSWSTIDSNADPSLFSWDVTTQSVDVTGARPTAHLVLDSNELSWVVRVVEDILYGTDTTDPRMPTPDELVDIYEAATSLRITYFPDGTYTAEGEDELLQVFPDGTFQINAPTAFEIAPGIFTVSSYA
jgi:hypothetical protein